MNEVNYILNTMSDRSLIIIDELCRSTSVEEGTAIAMMICESLAKSKAYTFITTHFTLLTKLADLFFNVKVWQLQTIPSGNPNDPKAMKLDFKFSLIPGVTSLRGYGVYMVRGIWPDDVLKLVDELQEQHTKQLQDPKIPTIDKRVRLKYDLDCHVKKLKLQRKFTLANLNMHVNHFYSEMQKLGGDHDQYSQNIMQQLQETTDDTSAGLDHSIFNASQSSNNCLVEELSKIGLKDLSSSLAEGDGDTAVQLNEEHIVFSSTTSQGSMQIASLSEARKRMEEVFTPNTQLDISQATSWSINLSQRFEPEINLSYAASSQCSLNFTQDALQDGEIQRENNGVLEKPHKSINIFAGYGNIEEEIPVSQLSSRGLSQKMEDIRKQEELATIVEKASMPPPHTNWISAPLNPPLVAESPFIGTFARPLQADARKTSTPLITMVKYDTINVGTSASTSMISERDLNVTRITTPRVSFTVPRNMENLDIASVVEELESLADALEEDDMDSDHDSLIDSHGPLPGINHPSSEEINSSHNEEQNTIEPTGMESDHDIVINSPQKIDNKKLILKDTKYFNRRHVFANVRIIPGPNHPSSEEINCSDNEEQNIIRPVVKNLQVDDNNVLVEAFDSLSNCKEPQSTIEEQNIIRPIVKNLQIEDNNALIEAFNSLSNCKELQSTTEEQNIIRPIVKNLQIEDNNALIEAFNSLSNCKEPQSTTEEQNIIRPIVKNLQIEDNNAPIEAFNSLSNCKEPQSTTEEQNIIRPIVKNLQIEDNNAPIEAFNSLSNCKEPQSTTEIIPNCEQIDVETNAAPETDEDIYETALSSEDTSCCYSPLTGEYHDKEDNLQTEIANIHNASHNTTNDEKYDEPIALDERTKETERIEEVIEISSDDDTQRQTNYVGDQIDKSDSKCNLNRSNESYKTDFDRSTEKFVISQSQKSINGDEITEKAVDDQDKNITQCDVENVAEKSQQNESANCDVVTILEELVVETVNDIVEDIPMPKDKDDKPKQQLEDLELTVRTNDCTEEDQEVVLEKQKTFVDIIQNATENCEDPTILPIAKPNEDNLQAFEKPLLEECSETSLNRRLKRKAKASSDQTPTGHEIRKKIKTQTDDKPSSESSSSNSAENKQKTRETTTSVSEASKLRNLDGASTSTSNERNGDSQGEETVTSLSDASRKRNLDKESTTISSTDKAISKSTPGVSDGSSPSTSKAVNKSQQKKKTKKFIAPLKKKKDDPTTSKDDSMKKPKPSFVEPSKMSQKAIRQVFFEQDKKFYESSGSSSELAKLWEERLNRPRPTPKQIQQSTCLATIRKTNDGIEVIPAEKKKPRASKKQQKILSSFSSASMNMNIFSDENAETFDQFIKSDNKDYKSFNFKFGYGGTTKKNDDGNGKMFDFRQVNSVASEYTSNSQSWTFVRKRSDEFNPFTLPSQASTSFPPLLTPNDFSLTPEGFYKQNREDINGLLQKYQ